MEHRFRTSDEELKTIYLVLLGLVNRENITPDQMLHVQNYAARVRRTLKNWSPLMDAGIGPYTHKAVSSIKE